MNLFGSGVFSFLVDLINNTYEDYQIVVAYGKRKETIENFKDYFPKQVKYIEVKNFTRSINLVKDLKALAEVKKIVKEEKPDIIHLHSSKAGAIGRIGIHKRKIKMLYNPHGFSFLKLDDSKIKRLIYRTIEKIIAICNHRCTIVGCSKGEYEEALKLNKNSICINNGLDIRNENLEERKIDYSNLKIFTIGRIGYQKNPQIFNKIANEFPNIQFTWIGDGELKNELKSKNIIVTGWLERKDVLREINNNDVFILPSLWEGLPISLLEAMYMKKICIVSNVIGNKDVIKSGINGYIANDFEDYISIIKNISEDITKNEKIRINANEDVKNNYSIEIMSKKYKAEYEG